MSIPMSSQRQGELERAIARAHREGVRIVARGHRKADGARVFGVTSASAGSVVLRMVVVLPGRLECDCPARVICKHRGVVHEALQQELEARRWAKLEAKPVVTRVTPAAVPELAAAESKEQGLARRRESSPLAQNDKPFSMWK